MGESVLAQAPKKVVLNFTEEAQIAFSVFKVYPLPLSDQDIATMKAQPLTPFDPDGGSDELAASTEEDTHSEGEEHSSEKGTIMGRAAESLIPSVIDITGDEAARVDTGVVEKDTSKTITLLLKDDLAPGAYVVMWRILSVDTHTLEGSLTFFVK
jgi:methionine-rich copper-binding protein CopC